MTYKIIDNVITAFRSSQLRYWEHLVNSFYFAIIEFSIVDTEFLDFSI